MFFHQTESETFFITLKMEITTYSSNYFSFSQSTILNEFTIEENSVTEYTAYKEPF